MTLVFPWYLAIIPLIVAIAIISVGGVLAQRGRKSGYLIVAFGILVGIVAGPTMFADVIRIDEQGIEHRTGIWLSQRVYGLQFDQTSRIEIKTELDNKGREQETWYFIDRSGEAERVDPGDLWVLNKETIADQCAKAGIEVIDYTSP